MTSIHDRALQAARTFRKAESDLIDIIQEIDSRKAYLDRDFASTFEYCVNFLKLSDNTSLDFIAVARKARTVPQLKEAIHNEAITVSKARRLTPVISQTNASHWLMLAQTLSKDKLQKEIAKIDPKVLTPERARYVTENRIKLEIGLSEEVMADFKRVQEILSQKIRGHADFEATLGHILKDFLRREDPLVKAQRILGKKRQTGTDVPTDRQKGKPNEYGPGHVLPGHDSSKQYYQQVQRPKEHHQQVHRSKEHHQQVQRPNKVNKPTEPTKKIEQKKAFSVPFERTAISSSLKHEINFRDNAQCTYVGFDGQRCAEKKWLQFHHVIPVSQGGQNQIENLKTVCFAHHKLMHTN